MELLGWEESELEDLMGYVPDDNKPIDEGEMSETENECPKCGFKW